MSSTKKLTQQAWAVIQAKYESGEPLKELARSNGITMSAISKRAKRQGWKKHGEMRAKAIEEAREKAHKDTALSYEDAAKETNERHLKYFQYSRNIIQLMLIQFKEYSEWLDNENRRNKESTTSRGYNPPKPIVPLREANTFYSLVSCLDKTVEAERKILGIDTPLLKKEQREQEDGLSQMCRVFEESVKLYCGQPDKADSPPNKPD